MTAQLRNVQHTVLHRHRDHHSKDTSRCVIQLATGILVLKEKRKEKLLPSFPLLANLAVHSLLVAHRCTTRSRSQHKSKWMAKSNTFPQYMKRKEWGQEQRRRPFLEEDDHPPTRAKLKKKITGIGRYKSLAFALKRPLFKQHGDLRDDPCW